MAMVRSLLLIVVGLALFTGATVAHATPPAPPTPSAHVSFRFIDVPGAIKTAPFGINNRGTVVGWYAEADEVRRGFVFDRRGRLTRLDVAGATSTLPASVNDRGVIAGTYFLGDGTIHGFFYEDGTYKSFDIPDRMFTTINGLNNRGDHVGL